VATFKNLNVHVLIILYFCNVLSRHLDVGVTKLQRRGAHTSALHLGAALTGSKRYDTTLTRNIFRPHALFDPQNCKTAVLIVNLDCEHQLPKTFSPFK